MPKVIVFISAERWPIGPGVGLRVGFVYIRGMKVFAATVVALLLAAQSLAWGTQNPTFGVGLVNAPAGDSYIILLPEEVAATTASLADYYALPTPMGAEAPARRPLATTQQATNIFAAQPLLWGALLSIPGVILVRVNSTERKVTQKALLGAGINAAILTVLYFTVISPVGQSK